MPPRPQSAEILLIGGGVASARCARMLRRRGFQGSIVLVGQEPALPYNRPPLSKELLRGEAPDELAMVEPPDWYSRHRVQLLTDVAVTELDVAARRVRLSAGRSMRFDRWLLATGAGLGRRHAPVGGQGITLRTLDDAE